MAPKLTAERCKKYRQYIKKYNEKRIPYEKETIAEKWKLIQLLTKKSYKFSDRKKRKYWQRDKESIATAAATNLVTEQNDDLAFSQAYIRSRNIQGAAKTPPSWLKVKKDGSKAFVNNYICHPRSKGSPLWWESWS